MRFKNYKKIIGGGGKMEKINKVQARKLYSQGSTIRVTCNKIHPKNLWGFWMDIRKKENMEYSFDELVSRFEVLNCNWETGYYAAYYILEK